MLEAEGALVEVEDTVQGAADLLIPGVEILTGHAPIHAAGGVDGVERLTVLDLAKVPAAERGMFAPKAGMTGLPTNEELGSPLLEPHPSWMTRITAQWEKRYSR